MSDDNKYFIWSIEHDAWWKPNEWGYTHFIEQAGRYSDADSKRIVTKANAYGRFNECRIPVECVIDVAPVISFGDDDAATDAHDEDACLDCRPDEMRREGQ